MATTSLPPVVNLSLEGDATIYTAAELFERVKAVLEASGPVELDLADVNEIDAAGVQILLLLKRETELAKRPLRLLGASPAVREVLRMLDLRSTLRG